MLSDTFADDNYGGAVWSAIECNMGVVCASLPAFKPIIDRFLPNLMGRSRGRSNVTPGEAIRPVNAVTRERSAKVTADWRMELAGRTRIRQHMTAPTTIPVAPRLLRVLHSTRKAAKSIQDLRTPKARIVASGDLRVWWSITAGFEFTGSSITDYRSTIDVEARC